MAQVTEIQVKIKSSNPFEAKAKMEAIKEIATLDCDSLQKLAELAKKPKAIEKLKSNFSMILSFLG